MRLSGTIIDNIFAREVIDSRGNPTVEAEVTLKNGIVGRAAVPSGASTGENEAIELRDCAAIKGQLPSGVDRVKRFNGKGVLAAVSNVNNFFSKNVIGIDASDQPALDALLIDLDGTENKSKLGANAILSVSLAAAHAAAKSYDMPLFRYIGGINSKVLPVPMMNVLNGGAHSDAPVDIQEFMIVPHNAPTVREAIRIGAEIFQSLKKILKGKNLSTAVGDEGGFAPDVKSNEHALEVVVQAIEKAGYRPSDDVSIAIDAAASEFYDSGSGRYIFKKSDKSSRSPDDMVAFYEELIKKFPIISIEDGLSEGDWDGWQKMMNRLGNKIQIVGDDLFVTNKKYLERGIKEKSANAILIKLNQIGTLTETLDTIEMAKTASFKSIVSHRSGETEDTTIADLAVATNAGQIKTGSMSRTDRVCKYNQLMRIELGKEAIYAGQIPSLWQPKR